MFSRTSGSYAEAVGGGVLIPEGHREDSDGGEVQSFVVPVANGIQLETRRHTRSRPADNPAATGDVSHMLAAAHVPSRQHRASCY